MEKMTFRAELQPVLDQILKQIPGVAAGKMFGLPGYHVGRKFFATLAGEGITLKLPLARVQELVGRPGYALFEPMPGRPMKEWVVITHADPEAYKNEVELFDEAIAYVASQVK